MNGCRSRLNVILSNVCAYEIFIRIEIDWLHARNVISHTHQPTHIHELNMQKLWIAPFWWQIDQTKEITIYFSSLCSPLFCWFFLSISRMKPTEINLMQNFYTYYLLMRLEFSTFTTLRDITLCSIDKWPSLYFFFVNVFFRAILDPILYFKRINFYSISNVLMW